MDKREKKIVAGLSAGAIGVAGAGIVAENFISNKDKDDSVSDTSFVEDSNFDYEQMFRQQVTELTGVTTSTTMSSTNSDTDYNSSIDTSSLGTTNFTSNIGLNTGSTTYTTAMPKGATIDSSISMSDITKTGVLNEKNIAVSGSKTTKTTKTTVDKDTHKSYIIKNDVSDYDYECYCLMQDAIARIFRRFNANYSSLSDVLTSTYDVQLSTAQKARYDTIMTATYEAYRKGIASYECGDMESFRRICDEIINSDRYLTFGDLVDILSININLQGDYIKDSSNYSISDGKLIIDGFTVDSLFPSATSVDRSNVMSLISFYEKGDKTILDILWLPEFIVKQATEPTNMTLIDYKTVYAYDNNELGKVFETINNEYASKLGLDRFGISVYNGKHDLFGYDKDNNKQIISEDNKYYSGLNFYIKMLNQYSKSMNARVGYFSGFTMKKFVSVFENGIEDVKVPGMYEVCGDEEYDCYCLMQDSSYFLARFNEYHLSLSDVLASTYGVELSPKQKERYNSIMHDTYKAYKKGIAAYESGHVSEFRGICNDILNGKKYLNRDDFIDILCLNINSQDYVINNSSNYLISKDKVVIDGVCVESLFDVPSYVKHYDAMSFLSMYDGASADDRRVLDIMQVPVFVVNEALSPTSFSLIVNGTVYAYRNDDLSAKFENINNYFVENIGLTNFGYEQNGGDVVFYGYDENSQKQYISNDSEYIRDLSRYLLSFYPSYQKSSDGRAGYFDGQMMKAYLNEFEEKLEKDVTR